MVLVFHLLKRKKEQKKFQDKVDLRDTYQNKLHKACFQQYMVYKHFKLLNRRIATDKLLHGKAFNIDKGPKDNGYQRGLAPMIYNFFDRKTSGRSIKNENISNRKLAEELHIPIIKNVQ